jgi:hypothetical protein
MIRCSKYLIIAASFCLAVGCSGSGGTSPVPAQEQTITLQEVNDLLHASAANGKHAAKLADLRRNETKFPRAYAAVKNGDVVVLWGTALQGEGQVGQNEAVLAYEKAVPSGGGFVLLSAGTIKKMTSAEFESAPKAGK